MIELLPENDPVSALRFLLLEAVNREVSDIHIEPNASRRLLGWFICRICSRYDVVGR